MTTYRGGFYRRRPESWELWSDVEDYAEGRSPELVVPAANRRVADVREILERLQEGAFDKGRANQ